MTKRKTTTSARKRGTSTATLIIFAVVFLLAGLARITGIDPFKLFTTPTPTATIGQTATPVQGTPVAALPSAVTMLTVPQGFGAQKSFWRVYFTAPSGSSDRTTYTNGIDTALVQAIGGAQRTLDMAAYEFNDPLITRAMLDAKTRGVTVRVVSDDDDGLGDSDTTLHQLVDAGIPVVTDDRNDLMHNKFVILDSTEVWTGSWNYTINDTYRNNNNALVMRSQQAVQDYQAEFDEMFAQGRFGPTSPSNTPHQQFTQDGDSIAVYFSPEDDAAQAMVDAVSNAHISIRFMTFSFTLDPVGAAMLERAQAGVNISGVFETTGSLTQYSELKPLYCAGLDVRQDGNGYVLHHKVFVIDSTIVLTGSFNVSANAMEANDENLVVITDPDLAAQYLQEFDRRWAESVKPTAVTCS